MVGRDHEIDLILAEYLRREVQGIVLTGVKGVGKSSLAAAAAERLAEGVGCLVTSVGACRALRSMPFAAIAHLAPGFEDGYLLLSQLIMQLREYASGLSTGPAQAVLVLDDAHLLDEESAAVLAELTARRLVFLIATAVAGQPVPQALAALWSRGRVLRVPVQPLAEEVMAELVASVLPGDRADAVSRHRLQRLAEGTPLALRMLVDATAAPDGLVRGLVEAWLDEAGPTVRSALDIVACAEPVPLHLLESLVDPAAIDAAEQAGLLRLIGEGRTLFARLAPPLSAPVMRPLVSRRAARHIFSKLTDLILRDRPLRGDDVLRAGIWQLDTGRVWDPEYLLPAARMAMDRSDLSLACRLVEAARQSYPGPACDLLLARVLALRGHGRLAADALPPPPVEPSEAGPGSPPDAEYATDWALVAAEIRYFGVGLPASAAERALAAHHGDRVQAKRSWIQLCDGRGRQALTSAQLVLSHPDAGPQAKIWAAAGGAAAAGLLGRRSLSESIFLAGTAAVAASRGEFQWGDAQVGYGICLARLLAGDLLAAQQSADQGYRDAVSAEVRPMAGIWAGLRGMIAKAQGRLRCAASNLRESLALLESDGPSGPSCVRIAAMAELASVAAMTGDSTEAANWLAAADAYPGPRLGVFGPWIEIGRAWSLACAGELTQAVVRARHAADLARDQGHAAYEAIALYDVARLGGPGLVHSRLTVLTRAVESDTVAAMALAARALARADELGLGQAADAFENLGHLPLAAEIAAAAAHAHHLSGRYSSAVLLQERSDALARRCEEVRTPLLGRSRLRSVLTLREREVVLMAATLTTPQIAARLALSPRTVSNYLQNAYDKLGVAGRPALRLFLGGQWPEADQRYPV
ncbi:MAG TPA: LuxR family transcriptional regulator [Streptosporangiaceae bacterium]|nr:LuxR family transcriptional regulator [Streptosporangiaceae bacterium]